MQVFKPRNIYIATLLWWVSIWVASSIPSNKLPSVRVMGLDKLMHCFVYLVLALLVNRSMALLKIRRSRAVWIYSLLLLTAALEEYHQMFIPGRAVSFWDFVANGTGLLIGFGIFWKQNDSGR